MEHLKIRSFTLVELAELAKIYLVNSPIKFSPEAIEVINNYNRNLINQVIDELQNCIEFNNDTVQIEFKKLAKNNNIKLGDLMQPIRPLMTSSLSSPSVFEIIAIIGKEHAVNRLKLL